MTLMINVSCTGSERTKRMVLHDGDELSVGRANDEASLIVDARLSRKHFNVQYANGKIIITHLSKTNPTLIASEGSSDFEKIHGEKIERDGCRIIAGSHRFVLKVVKSDSVHDDGVADDFHTEATSQEDSSRFWSDVDSAAVEAPAQHLFSEEATPGPASTSRETLPSHDVHDDSLGDVKTGVQKPIHHPGLFDDDSSDSDHAIKRDDSKTVKQSKAPRKEALKSKPVKKDPPKPKTKKPFFPVTDDFFDD